MTEELELIELGTVSEETKGLSGPNDENGDGIVGTLP